MGAEKHQIIDENGLRSDFHWLVCSTYPYSHPNGVAFAIVEKEIHHPPYKISVKRKEK